jgi:hypothetical protein
MDSGILVGPHPVRDGRPCWTLNNVETPTAMPSMAGVDQESLAGLHQQATYRVQALSYSDMFIVVALATGVGVLLVKRPPVPAPEVVRVPG